MTYEKQGTAHDPHAGAHEVQGRDKAPAKVTTVSAADLHKGPTIHDQARERFELAMMYGEDGAIATAASILEEIALAYRTRANTLQAGISLQDKDYGSAILMKDNGGD